MNNYTPTTEEVREDYELGRNEVAGAGGHDQYRAEFNRWLNAHDAEKRAEWEAERRAGDEATRRQIDGLASDYYEAIIRAERAEQGETEWEVEHGILLKIGGNWAETEWEPEQFDEVVAGYPHNEYVRAERKVTPWLPVPGSTVRESDSGVRDSDNDESEGE